MVEFEHEKLLQAKGFSKICGVDEAGRGPLAGPVCAAAVILPVGLTIEGLNDSKKLSPAKREQLYDNICQQAEAYSVAFASVDEIEEYNILNATFMAMMRSIEGLKVPADFALIDGNKLPPTLSLPAKAVVGGDGISASIAAASILAKVTRDRLMQQMAEEYPGYLFEKHKGYGTKEHVAALRELGPCPIHRMSFLRKILK